METDSAGSPRSTEVRTLLGPVRQIGYVVLDVEATARDWVQRMGVGPWSIAHGISFDDCRSGGRETDVQVSIASSYSGGVEVELIAQTGGAPSMYSDFLAAGGPGVQHVCFFPVDYDEAFDHLVGSGADVVLEASIAGTRFAYLGDQDGQVIEIADVPAAGVAARIDRAHKAEQWDGTDPIRVR